MQNGAMKKERQMIPRTRIVCALAIGFLPASGCAHVEELESALNRDRVVRSAPVSLLDAIVFAEESSTGSAVSAEIEASNGKPIYEIETFLNRKVAEYSIDPFNGEIEKVQERTGRIDSLLDSDGLRSDRYSQATLSLASAIKAVDVAENEFVIAGGFESDEPRPAYEVEIALPSRKIKSVTVDARTGEILQTKIENEIDLF